jgi:hypothetical protein
MSSVAPSPPEQGQLVSVRARQWIVNGVRPSTLPAPALNPSFRGPQHLLTLAAVEDDGLRGELQVMWKIECGARVIEKVALPEPTGFDPPDKLDAVRWGAASTADVQNIQAPFRSGILTQWCGPYRCQWSTCSSPAMFDLSNQETKANRGH